MNTTKHLKHLKNNLKILKKEFHNIFFDKKWFLFMNFIFLINLIKTDNRRIQFD